ncbi:uncharacterized [Tachysurus ichikawai]
MVRMKWREVEVQHGVVQIYRGDGRKDSQQKARVTSSTPPAKSGLMKGALEMRSVSLQLERSSVPLQLEMRSVSLQLEMRSVPLQLERSSVPLQLERSSVPLQHRLYCSGGDTQSVRLSFGNQHKYTKGV